MKFYWFESSVVFTWERRERSLQSPQMRNLGTNSKIHDFFFELSLTFIRRKFTRRVFLNANIDAMALLSVDAHTTFMSNQKTNRSVTDFILTMIKWHWNFSFPFEKWHMNRRLPYSVSRIEIIIESNVWCTTEYDYQRKTIKAHGIA